jgi:methyl-accepting chemotaxis protein
MFKFEFKSMTQRFATAVIIILIIVCAGMGIISYKMSANAIIEEVEEALLNFSRQSAKEVLGEVEKGLNVLEITAYLDRIRSTEVGIEEKLSVLRSVMETTDFQNMGIVDTEGNLVLVDNQTTNVSDREYFQRALRGETCVSDPIFNRADGFFSLVSATPIYAGNSITGVLIGDRYATFLNDLTDEMGLGKRGYAYIVNSKGVFIAHQNRELVQNEVDYRELAKSNTAYKGAARVVEALVSQKHGTEIYSFEGEERLTAYHPIGTTGWGLATATFKNETLAGATRLRNVILLLSIAAIILGAIATVWLGRKNFAIIGEASLFADLMARGDFTYDVPDHALNRKDEIGDMGKSLDRMEKSLRKMFAIVKQGTDKVYASSDALASSSEEMNAGLEEVSATANEFAGSAQNLSESSERMYKLGTEVAEKAQGGYEAAEKAASQMKEITTSVTELQVNVTSLNSEADKVGNIIDTIKGIAGQTNLLALNAAIEAARAGEQGRGFAVVAEEVRKLAEQSASSAEEITNIIEFIQSESHNVAQKMKESVEEVAGGTEAVYSASNLFKTIIDEIQSIVEQIEQVAAATQEISSGSEEVSAAVEEQTATMNEIANAATDLQGLVAGLEEAVNVFKFDVESRKAFGMDVARDIIS